LPKVYRLAEQRKRSRLTQHELAKLSGVSRPTIASVELGYRGARMSTIRKLAKVLKVKPEDLTERSEEYMATDEGRIGKIGAYSGNHNA